MHTPKHNSSTPFTGSYSRQFIKSSNNNNTPKEENNNKTVITTFLDGASLSLEEFSNTLANIFNFLPYEDLRLLLSNSGSCFIYRTILDKTYFAHYKQAFLNVHYILDENNIQTGITYTPVTEKDLTSRKTTRLLFKSNWNLCLFQSPHIISDITTIFSNLQIEKNTKPSDPNKDISIPADDVNNTAQEIFTTYIDLEKQRLLKKYTNDKSTNLINPYDQNERESTNFMLEIYINNHISEIEEALKSPSGNKKRFINAEINKLIEAVISHCSNQTILKIPATIYNDQEKFILTHFYLDTVNKFQRLSNNYEETNVFKNPNLVIIPNGAPFNLFFLSNIDEETKELSASSDYALKIDAYLEENALTLEDLGISPIITIDFKELSEKIQTKEYQNYFHYSVAEFLQVNDELPKFLSKVIEHNINMSYFQIRILTFYLCEKLNKAITKRINELEKESTSLFQEINNIPKENLLSNKALLLSKKKALEETDNLINKLKLLNKNLPTDLAFSNYRTGAFLQTNTWLEYQGIARLFNHDNKQQKQLLLTRLMNLAKYYQNTVLPLFQALGNFNFCTYDELVEIFKNNNINENQENQASNTSPITQNPENIEEIYKKIEDLSDLDSNENTEDSINFEDSINESSENEYMDEYQEGIPIPNGTGFSLLPPFDTTKIVMAILEEKLKNIQIPLIENNKVYWDDFLDGLFINVANTKNVIPFLYDLLEMDPSTSQNTPVQNAFLLLCMGAITAYPCYHEDKKQFPHSAYAPMAAKLLVEALIEENNITNASNESIILLKTFFANLQEKTSKFYSAYEYEMSIGNNEEQTLFNDIKSAIINAIYQACVIKNNITLLIDDNAAVKDLQSFIEEISRKNLTEKEFHQYLNKELKGVKFPFVLTNDFIQEDSSSDNDNQTDTEEDTIIE